MSKFWQKKYTSKYTGAEIDAAVGNAKNMPDWSTAKSYNTPIYAPSTGWFFQSGIRSGAQGAEVYQYQEDTNKMYGVFPQFEDDHNMYFIDAPVFICRREPDSLIQWISTNIPANLPTVLADYKMHIFTDTKIETDTFPIRDFCIDLVTIFSESTPMKIAYVKSLTFGLTPVIGGIQDNDDISYGGILFVPTLSKYVKVRIELDYDYTQETSQSTITMTLYAQQIETA